MRIYLWRIGFTWLSKSLTEVLSTKSSVVSCRASPCGKAGAGNPQAGKNILVGTVGLLQKAGKALDRHTLRLLIVAVWTKARYGQCKRSAPLTSPESLQTESINAGLRGGFLFP